MKRIKNHWRLIACIGDGEMDIYGKNSQISFSLLVLLFLLSIFAFLSPFCISTVTALTYPTEPVKISPIITVNSPHQGTYTTSNVTLNFSVNAPGSWYREGAPLVYFRNVTYQIDTNTPVPIWTTGQSYACLLYTSPS